VIFGTLIILESLLLAFALRYAKFVFEQGFILQLKSDLDSDAGNLRNGWNEVRIEDSLRKKLFSWMGVCWTRTEGEYSAVRIRVSTHPSDIYNELE